MKKKIGRLDLQSTAATHVYLNPNHPIAEELLEKLVFNALLLHFSYININFYIYMCRYDPDILLENKQLSLLASNAERITVSELLVKEHPIPPVNVFA